MSWSKWRSIRMLAAVGALGVSTPVWAMHAAPGELEVRAKESAREGATRLRSGSFQGLAHETSGSASVYQLADGRRVLRLEGLRTSNGPDLRVYLVEGDDASDAATIQAGRFVSLGRLKGNIGNQNYVLPAEVDLERYRSVSIWCERFSVNFGAAPLRAVGA